MVRYLIPGWLLFSLVSFYYVRVRYGSKDIISFVSHTLKDWPSLFAIGIPVCIFSGILLVGLDRVIRGILGSRLMELVNRLLLSSPLFDPRFVHSRHLRKIQNDLECFMMRHSDALGLTVTPEKEYVVSEFESRLWIRLKPGLKRMIEYRTQFQCMFFSLSFVSLIGVAFQLLFIAYWNNRASYDAFVNHMDLFRRTLLLEHLFSAFTEFLRSLMELIRRSDSLFLLAFISMNMLTNVISFLLFRCDSWKLKKSCFVVTRRILGKAAKSLYGHIQAGAFVIVIAYLLGKYLYWYMPFWAANDFLVLYLMFVFHVTSYYAGCLEYNRVADYLKAIIPSIAEEG